jgi:glutamine synthetase
VKCFDLAANPYLVAGSVIAAGLAGLDAAARLPAETVGDPAGLPAGELDRRGIRRLPRSLAEATRCLEDSAILREAMGNPLFEAFVAVRHAESALFAGVDPADVVAQTRWQW